MARPRSPAMAAAPVDGQLLNRGEVEHTYGIPAGNQDKFWQVATQYNVVITVRPSNPSVPEHLRAGAKPKGEEIKAKTVSEMDVLLGVSERSKGLVAYYRPATPMFRPWTPRTAEKVDRRKQQRRTEHVALHDAITRLIESGRYRIQDDLLWAVDDDGRITPITGDHNLWDIRDLDGNVLPVDVYNTIVQTMKDSDMAVMHRARICTGCQIASSATRYSATSSPATCRATSHWSCSIRVRCPDRMSAGP